MIKIDALNCISSIVCLIVFDSSSSTSMSAPIPLTNDFDNPSDQNVERHNTNKTTFDSMGPSPSGNLNDSLVPSPSKPEYIEDSDEADL